MADYIVETQDMQVYFSLKGENKSGLFRGPRRTLKAVDGVDLAIQKGEILSLVGESGSGKTTTGKAILQLVPPTGGKVLFEGGEIDPKNKEQMHAFRQKAQMIYQDPYQSLNPRDVISDIVAEPLDVNKLVGTKSERDERVRQALEDAGLSPAEDYLYRYPTELSGGQRQRVVIASSMIMNPQFVVADEPVSMLDASIRTGILRLMMQLRQDHGLAYLFITHDLSLGWLISDRIAIMYLGRIVELADADTVIYRGLHPYTKALIGIMPVAGKVRVAQRELLKGETPNATEDIPGCNFCGRCPVAQQRCKEEDPKLREVAPGHKVACHFV